jgi:hypothetical protein
MHKQWYPNHKTWTSDNWKCECHMVRWVVLRTVPYIGKSLHLENTQASLQTGMPGSNSEPSGRFCEGCGSSIVVQSSISPIITLHGWITAREYVTRLGSEVHPIIQMLFPNNNALFQDYSAPIHMAWTVQSWFEEHKGELQHLPCPA